MRKPPATRRELLECKVKALAHLMRLRRIAADTTKRWGDRYEAIVLTDLAKEAIADCEEALRVLAKR